ncbi:MAG: S-layer homology domain-containing protein [Clostridia bacterium]|nr:S-layer homology domain-containing protein [Clostridia bacterium]
MKKSILLFCIAALAVGSTASAAEIDAKLILRKVDVKVTDTKNSQTPAIQLLNSDKTKMLYTDEGINENGDYLFDSFSFPMDAQSGSYVLRVGEDGNISEISIKYTAYDEAIRALETIKNDKSTISAQISEYPELFGTNDADFEILGEDWKKRLEKDISETDIKYENEEEAVSTINIIQNIVRKITDWAKLTDSADEQKTESAIKAIEALAEKKIVSGRGDGRFEPNESLTRAEFVKIIVDAFDLKDNTAEIDFDDVPKDAWSYRYIASAKKAGIIYGISDTHFGADKTISRQDMAVILLRTAELKGIDTSGNGVEFTDSQKISDYARDAVGRLSAAGILNGMNDGSFSPLTDVTRAQGAQVIYTMLGRKG